MGILVHFFSSIEQGNKLGRDFSGDHLVGVFRNTQGNDAVKPDSQDQVKQSKFLTLLVSFWHPNKPYLPTIECLLPSSAAAHDSWDWPRITGLVRLNFRD